MIYTKFQDILPKENFENIKGYLLEMKLKNEHRTSWLRIKGMNCSSIQDPIVIELLYPLFSKVKKTQLETFANENTNVLSGFEWWINRNKQHRWHLDKDEIYYKYTKHIRLADRSYVYYVCEPQVGGELEFDCQDNPVFGTENILVKPEENSLTTFDSSCRHRVKQFTGERISIAFNYFSAPTVSFKPN